MTKQTSEKILIAGAVAGGAYLIYKTFINPEIPDGSGTGSIGGSDDQFEDDLLGQQGFDIDPNAPIPYDPYVAVNEAINTPIEEPIITPRDNPTSTSPTPTYTPSNDIIVQAEADIAGGTPPAITLPQYGLGVVSLTGTYASAFGKQVGKSLLKNTDDVALSTTESIFKRTAKEGVGDIPFFGKQAKSFVFDQADDVTVSGVNFVFDQADDVAVSGVKSLGKNIAKETGEAIIETGFKAGIKKAGKTIAGYGLKAIPFAGVGAGIAFDIATTPQYKADYEAGGWRKLKILAVSGTAQVVGDLLGSAGAVLTSPAVATGIGTAIPVAVGIGGQVVGEQLIYQPYNLFNKLFGGNDDEEPIITQNSDFKNQPLLNSFVNSSPNQGTNVPNYSNNLKTINTSNNVATSPASSASRVSVTSSGGKTITTTTGGNLGISKYTGHAIVKNINVSSGSSSRSSSRSSSSSSSSRNVSRGKTVSGVRNTGSKKVSVSTGNFGVSKYSGHKITKRITVR